MENVNQNNYLGKEDLSKLLAKFAVPCILSLIISCLYNIIDQIFVGNMIGTAGNAATGIIFPITVIGWGASLFFGDGAAAYLSMALGKGETEKIHASIGNAVLMSFISGIIIIAAAYIGSDGLLVLLGAKYAKTLQLAYYLAVFSYFVICSVKKYNRIYFRKRSLLPFHQFRHNFICNTANQTRRSVDTVNITNMILYIADRHAFLVHCKDASFHIISSSLPFFNNLETLVIMRFLSLVFIIL